MSKTTASSALAQIREVIEFSRKAYDSYFNSIETAVSLLQKDKDFVILPNDGISCRVVTPEEVRYGYITAIRVRKRFENSDEDDLCTEVFRSDKAETPSEDQLKDETRWSDIHDDVYSETSLVTDEEFILLTLEGILLKKADNE